MACIYGGEPKFPEDSTITFDPYEGLNTQAQFFLTLAGVARPMTFDPQELCSSTPPSVQEITLADFAFPATLKDKVENNARAAAWFKGCQCRPKPANPEPPVDPDPPDLPRPDAPPPLPFDITCGSQRERSAWVVQFQIYDRQDLDLVPVLIQKEYDFLTYPDLLIAKDRPIDDDFYVESGGIRIDRVPSAFSGRIGYNYKIIFCEGLEQPPIPEPELPPFPDFCPPQEGNDCLKQPDKAEIISELKLWISESNDRIRDEIGGYIYGAKQEITEAVFTARDQLDSLVRAQFLTDREQAILDFQSVKDEINSTEELLQDWIDGAKNQILSSIGGAIAALGSGIFAAFTSLTTALAATQTAVLAAITAARTAIEGKIESEANSTKSDLRKKMNAIAYKRLIVQTHVTVIPANASITSGRTGAPDKIAAGWLQFHRARADGNTTYFERQFITNVYNRFVSPEPADGMGYVIHTIAGYTITSSSIQGEFEDEE